MSDTAIRIQGLGKQYRIGASRPKYRTLRGALINVAKIRLPRFKRTVASLHRTKTFWALKDLSMQIGFGEVVGIVGRNGAGKSTLLKIISGITEPTMGTVEIYGRIGSLLEVGTGFHPELTGRENIYLNGAILGMKRSDLKRQFDEIVAFSEVERFLDTAVKHYSSGMYVRLAFAVAAHLEPEILLVDEVLAVGDAAFQRKCLGKIKDIGKEGRTVLFVSHNLAMILKLCQRCIWLDAGKTVMDGDPSSVVERYYSYGLIARGERIWDNLSEAPGDDHLRLISARIQNNEGKTINIVDIVKGFCIQLDYQVFRPISDVALEVWLHDSNGTVVFVTGDRDKREPGFVREPGFYRSECVVPGDFLNSGSYYVGIHGHVLGIKVIFSEDNVLQFDVLQSVAIAGEAYRRLGFVRPLFDWSIRRLGP